MDDSHLNLFFSYNRDNELIENNLTRAFIVTLGILSPSTRDSFLRTLLISQTAPTSLQEIISKLSFENANFALQSNIEKESASKAKVKYILAIASYSYETPLEQLVDIESMTDIDPTPVALYKSIPDGWVYDHDKNYCFLIESKVGSNPVKNNQIASVFKIIYSLYF